MSEENKTIIEAEVIEKEAEAEKAEAETQKIKAKIAKAEAEKVKAEAEKAKAEADEATAQAEKAKAKAKKAKAEAKAEAEEDKDKKSVGEKILISGKFALGIAATILLIWGGIIVANKFGNDEDPKISAQAEKDNEVAMVKTEAEAKMAELQKKLEETIATQNQKLADAEAKAERVRQESEKAYAVELGKAKVAAAKEAEAKLAELEKAKAEAEAKLVEVQEVRAANEVEPGGILAQIEVFDPKIHRRNSPHGEGPLESHENASAQKFHLGEVERVKVRKQNGQELIAPVRTVRDSKGRPVYANNFKPNLEGNPPIVRLEIETNRGYEPYWVLDDA